MANMKTKKPKPFKLNRQQERMFTSAGFVALRTADGVLEGHPLDLCYWKRGDIRIATTATRSYTMLEFVSAVVHHVGICQCGDYTDLLPHRDARSQPNDSVDLPEGNGSQRYSRK